MNIRENIVNDYNDAVRKSYSITKFALSKLLDNIENCENDDQVFKTIDQLIEERGQKIMKNSLRSNGKNVENDIFLMNLYNTYLWEHQFKKKRQIVLIYDENEVNNFNYDKNLEHEPKEIVRKKSWIEKIF